MLSTIRHKLGLFWEKGVECLLPFYSLFERS
nr:MAG TPA: hypothetical protein [Caudoviricetes sp.]